MHKRHCAVMPPAFSDLAIALDTPPMEATLASEIPSGEGWQFEPKWDGFRCLAFREGDAVELMSKSGKPLARYFPEVAEAILALDVPRLVLDGELVLPVGDILSFAALQLRLHPSASRIAKLSRDTPAQLMLFDALQIGDDALLERPLAERRKALERFMRRAAGPRDWWRSALIGWFLRCPKRFRHSDRQQFTRVQLRDEAECRPRVATIIGSLAPPKEAGL